ncbi:uncharacterized protein MYCFIDRAFT_172980 [Pseudocercospora fijiensis CIRAD86]|uniref:Uncharacterized protein n=1 Tax=Pseudocercospora fijiensis (strain CIRAD86) TaxID=383855 RepID=M2Z260_PSEFD|nr:uncharacterized protein MYCFIDRAFT_172980 [Pseudocercospora fijiensis CIRAD86]EME83910.1 hypothetical protein MYCFIDRAFT_172980 [Pseudocercospora fijiensis CIRAD86]
MCSYMILKSIVKHLQLWEQLAYTVLGTAEYHQVKLAKKNPPTSKCDEQKTGCFQERFFEFWSVTEYVHIQQTLESRQRAIRCCAGNQVQYMTHLSSNLGSLNGCPRTPCGDADLLSLFAQLYRVRGSANVIEDLSDPEVVVQLFLYAREWDEFDYENLFHFTLCLGNLHAHKHDLIENTPFWAKIWRAKYDNKIRWLPWTKKSFIDWPNGGIDKYGITQETMAEYYDRIMDKHSTPVLSKFHDQRLYEVLGVPEIPAIPVDPIVWHPKTDTLFYGFEYIFIFN